MVDIDNAFLNGDLEHEIYMKIPEGYDEVINPRVDKEDCLILQKAIYGLVQAASQFWKKIVDKMQEGGFKLSEADPCILYKEDEKGVCIIIIYVDDMLIIGKEEDIDDAIKVLQGHVKVLQSTVATELAMLSCGFSSSLSCGGGLTGSFGWKESSSSSLGMIRVVNILGCLVSGTLMVA